MKKFIIYNQRGLGLVEILVASVVLVMTTLSIMSVFTTGYIVLKRAEASNRAVSFAKEKMEEIQNLAIEDIYPADCPRQPPQPCVPSRAFDRDGILDGVLTERAGTVPPIPGTDAKIICPICGAVAKSNDARSTGATGDGNYYCLNNDFNNDGIGGDWCGGASQRIIVTPDPHLPTWTYTRTVSITRLPGPGQLGWYTRQVRVRAYSVDETTNQFTNYDFVGMFDPKGERAPVKEIKVDVQWKGLGEAVQSYKLHSLQSRIMPKYVSREMGR
ncbi:MAG: hypothetical protein DDT23_01220 [candidate division WS2 bacterium]|nr:hypothetical protein [Candidatus Lithacetigena glycinireducens]